MSNFSAVLVGINKYKNSPLRGCCNDIIVARDILVRKYGVPAGNIRMLLDGRATKANIEERLEWLATNGTENKYFHYSGHGAQVPVRDYTNNAEPDGMDEILCPVDFNWENRFITDNQIDAILSKMPDNHHMTMVIDSCHSGDVDKNLSLLQTGAPQIIGERMLETPLDLMSRMSDNTLSIGLDLEDLFPETETETETRKPKLKPKTSRHNVSIITGCQEYQTSADAYMSGRFQGALSFFLQKALVKHPNISLEELWKRCVKDLKKSRFTQIPQLIGSEENWKKPFIQV